MKKKFLAMLLALTMALSLAASGEAIVDGAFQESVLRSAPYFALRIDGITELNNN